MNDYSVIIPCYNRRDMVGEALDSILSQSIPPREVFVVDDGSKDGSPEAVEAYERKTGGIVKLIRQANAGPSVARNQGLDRATSTFIAFLDADDLWLPGKMERQLEAMRREPDVVGVYSRFFKFTKTLDDLHREEPQNLLDDPSLEHILMTMCIQASSTVLRRAMVSDLRFDNDARPAEDALYFVEARLRGRWRMIESQLAAYRVHGVQVTADPWHAVKHTTARVRWINRHTNALGDDTASRLKRELWAKLINQLEKRYWARHFEQLREMCDEVAKQCPEQFEKSVLAKRKFYPRWVYKITDALRR